MPQRLLESAAARLFAGSSPALRFFMVDVKKGIYKHYKGKMYEVLGIGRHSETLEEFVIYKTLYDGEFGKV